MEYPTEVIDTWQVSYNDIERVQTREDLDQEVLDRIAADISLSNLIVAEEQARIAGDAYLQAEIIERDGYQYHLTVNNSIRIPKTVYVSQSAFISGSVWKGYETKTLESTYLRRGDNPHMAYTMTGVEGLATTTDTYIDGDLYIINDCYDGYDTNTVTINATEQFFGYTTDGNYTTTNLVVDGDVYVRGNVWIGTNPIPYGNAKEYPDYVWGSCNIAYGAIKPVHLDLSDPTVKVGVATYTPQYTLDVNGSLNAPVILEDGVSLSNIYRRIDDMSVQIDASQIISGTLSNARLPTDITVTNINVTAVNATTVTANTYYGDGSHLTGVVATEVADLSITNQKIANETLTIGKINPTQLSGDGAKLLTNANAVVTDATVLGTLTVDNLNVIGTTTVIDTQIQVTDQFLISNAGTAPALRVEQSGLGKNIAEFIDTEGGSVVIADTGMVGIGTANPTQKLEVNGTVKATTFQGNLASSYITGSITDSQIASLATSKLTGTITNSQLAGSISEDKIVSLPTTKLTGTVANNQTTATSANTANAIVARDASGNFSAGTITATTFSGSGANLTNIPNSATTATSANTANAIVARNASGGFSAGVITATTFSGSGASLTNIPNSATTATDLNTASAIVARDASGNFSAGTITATFAGNGAAITGLTASQIPSLDASKITTGNMQLNKYLKKDPTDNPDYIQANGALGRYVAFYNGSVNCAMPFAGTIIYEYNPTTGKEVVKQIKTTSSTTATISVTQGCEYYSNGRPVDFIGIDGNAITSPMTAIGSYFGFLTTRSSPHSVFIYSPFNTVTVNYYINKSTDSATADATFEVLPRTVYTYTITDTGTNWHFFRVIGGMVCMSKQSTNNDRNTLYPASSIMFLKWGTGKTIKYTDPTTASDVFYTTDGTPICVSQIADGAGGDMNAGVPLEMLGDTYCIGHNLDDFYINTVYPNTEIHISYLLAGVWTKYKSVTMTATASITAPATYEEGSQAGSGTPLVTDATMWMFSANQPFYLRTNDTQDDEYSPNGWLSQYYSVLSAKSSSSTITETSDEKIGIGVTNPAQKLDVNGSIRLSATTEDRYLEIGAGRTGNNYAYVDLIGDATYTDFGLRLLRGDTGANTWSTLQHRGTGNFYIEASEAAPLIFKTTDTERIRITSDGKVGIGVNNPSKLLEIVSTDTANSLFKATTDYPRIYHESADANVQCVYNYEASKNVYWGEDTDTGGYYFRGRTLYTPKVQAVNITGYGNTDAGLPFTYRNISSGQNAYSIIGLGNDTSEYGLVLFTNSSGRTLDGGGNVATIRNDIGSLRLQSKGANGMFIESETGYIGLGTATPLCPFHVTAGDISFPYNYFIRVSKESETSWTNGTTKLIGAYWNGAIGDMVGIYTPGSQSATEKITISSTGLVGINQTSPSTTLDVNGIVRSKNLMVVTSDNSEGGQIVLAFPNTAPTGQDASTWNIDVADGNKLRFFTQDSSGNVTSVSSITTDGILTTNGYKGSGISYETYTTATGYTSSAGIGEDANSTSWDSYLHFSANDGRIGIVYSFAEYEADASGAWVEYAVPSGMKQGYLSHLCWVNCRYFDILGKRTDGNYITISRVNAYNNQTGYYGAEHNGVVVVPIIAVDRFTHIRIQGRKGRFHLMGIGWTKEDRRHCHPLSFIHSDNIVGDTLVTAGGWNNGVRTNYNGTYFGLNTYWNGSAWTKHATGQGGAVFRGESDRLQLFMQPTGSDTVSEYLSIMNANGRVGIANANPQQQLDVNGSIRLSALANEDRYIEIGAGRSGNNYSYIDLIGDPTFTDYGLRLIRGNGGANTWSALQHRGTGDFYIETQEAASLIFKTTATERMRVTAGGNVTIANNLTVATAKLITAATQSDYTLLGTHTVDGVQNPRIVVSGHTRGINAGGIEYYGTNWGEHIFYTNTTEKMRIKNNGNVGIGTASPTTKLEVNGSTKIQGILSSAVGRYIPQYIKILTSNYVVTTQANAMYGLLRDFQGNARLLPSKVYKFKVSAILTKAAGTGATMYRYLTSTWDSVGYPFLYLKLNDVYTTSLTNTEAIPFNTTTMRYDMEGVFATPTLAQDPTLILRAEFGFSTSYTITVRAGAYMVVEEIGDYISGTDISINIYQ